MAPSNRPDEPPALRAENALRELGFQLREGMWRRDETVGAIATEAGVAVGWLDVAWNGPAFPEWLLRDPVHVTPGRLRDLEDVVARAADAGLAARCTCETCGRSFQPGHMHDEQICQGCAQRDLGVVH